MKPEVYLEQFFCWYESDDYLALYKARRVVLRALYKDYSTATGGVKRYLDMLLSVHAEYAKQRNPEDQRRHNAFVLRYVAGISTKVIALRLNVHPSTVVRDLGIVMDDLMVMAFGVEGLVPYEYIQVPKLP